MTSPPRARLTFRVGIVGHRPNRLPHDAERLARLRQTIRAILEETRAAVLAIAQTPDAALYASEPPLLRAISPLAEGADRIFAEEALALGYELCCPMPFAQAEFEKDFAEGAALEPNSLAHFRELLARAGSSLTIFEMDGERAHASEAYGAAGRVVLNQTDLLIGVWDGGEPAGRGGTVDTLHEAIRYHVPVIRIDALAPENWHLPHAASELGEQAAQDHTRKNLAAAVTRIVKAELDLPPPAPDYFAERQPRFNPFFFWKLFRNLLVDGSPSVPALFVGDFEASLDTEWPVADSAPKVSDWVNSRLRSHFAWADGLADYYADAYRSAFVLSYLLAAAAVFAAMLPVVVNAKWIFAFNSRVEIAGTVCEFIFLLAILLLLGVGRARRWHERWTQYRLLAELIRELRFMIPLGGGKPLPRIPAHLAVYGDPARTWMYWHMRAIARQTGIPGARVTPAYVRECLDYLQSVVGDANSGQWQFHLQSERRARLLGLRLRRAAFFLFALTVVCVGIRLPLNAIAGKIALPPVVNLGLILAAVVLPALGAALEGITNQGEFTRVAKRSAAMASGFAKYAGQIAHLERAAPTRLADVIGLSGRIAAAMVDEVVDWRAVFIDRPQ